MKKGITPMASQPNNQNQNRTTQPPAPPLATSTTRTVSTPTPSLDDVAETSRLGATRTIDADEEDDNPTAAYTSTSAPSSKTTEEVAYYSKSTNLCIQVNPGKEVRDGDTMRRVGQKHIQFAPYGGARYAKWGVARTSDPEVIAFLNKRMAQPNSDIFDYNKFMLLSANPNVTIQDQQRTIGQQNKLIAQLQQQLAEAKQRGSR
jgi:hypothetical protein